jgi:hypothetical protein
MPCCPYGVQACMVAHLPLRHGAPPPARRPICSACRYAWHNQERRWHLDGRGAEQRGGRPSALSQARPDLPRPPRPLQLQLQQRGRRAQLHLLRPRPHAQRGGRGGRCAGQRPRARQRRALWGRPLLLRGRPRRSPPRRPPRRTRRRTRRSSRRSPLLVGAPVEHLEQPDHQVASLGLQSRGVLPGGERRHTRTLKPLPFLSGGARGSEHSQGVGRPVGRVSRQP